MDSDATVAMIVGGGGDRISRLGDAALGHILSFLPATEAARTATLSRRWRHVFAAVHTLSFGESEAALRTGYRWWRRCSYCDNGDVRAPRFVAGVSAALHGRHRAAAGAPPLRSLRSLRVAFDEHGFRGGHDATTAVDGWLSYSVHAAAAAGSEGLEIDLRLDTEPICERAYALRAASGDDVDATMAEAAEGHAAAVDDEEEEEPRPAGEKYVVPRSIFSSCAALRVLRLTGCWINVPAAAAAIALPTLDTLHLTRVAGRRGAVQRLVSACPSLADLTLEACGTNLTELSIHGGARRLRRLAIRCCHGLTSVTVGSPELQAFEYRGDIPAPSFLTMPMHAAAVRKQISFCALDFCGAARRAGGEVFGLLELFAGVERLHLTSARLGSSFIHHDDDGAFPCFPRLRNLEITGMLPDYGDDASAAISTVARILERTPRLETLSLFFLPETHTVKQRGPYIEKEVLDASHELRYNPHAWLPAPPRDIVGDVPRCLRETTREINLVHYQGSLGQRALAKFLLCNAPMVDEVCWKVARGPLSIQRKLEEEVIGWVVNKSAKMVFF